MGNSSSTGVTVYGKLPPQHTTLEDLCGPSLSCPECPVSGICEDNVKPPIKQLTVTKFINVTLPGLSPRVSGK